jgi:hypothetical protein
MVSLADGCEAVQCRGIRAALRRSTTALRDDSARISSVEGPSVRGGVCRTAGVEVRKRCLQAARWHGVHQDCDFWPAPRQLFSSVAAFAESISAQRSASVFCRGPAQSLRAASNTAPCSTKELVESTTKWCVESEDVDQMCALISCSACSLSSVKVLTPAVWH